jgi:aldehyde dehydrogenase
VVVDETADIDKAAVSIIQGAAFDNNILCIGEKEVYAVRSIAGELKRCLLQNGCVELDRAQTDALAKEVFVVDDKGEWAACRNYVGRSPQVLAEAIGLTVPADTQLLIGEVDHDHPFVQHEQMMPFVPLVQTQDVLTAIDMAIEAEHGYYHTAVMHSKNVENMTVMARKCRCAIFVKNGPSSAGLGAGGEGYTSFSIATPTGEGCTSARTFTRQRRCALVDYFRIV